jgi:hypothetical protein
MTATCFHEQFEALLPKIKESARFAFRAVNPSDRDEAVADVCAAVWSAWHATPLTLFVDLQKKS